MAGHGNRVLQLQLGAIQEASFMVDEVATRHRCPWLHHCEGKNGTRPGKVGLRGHFARLGEAFSGSLLRVVLSYPRKAGPAKDPHNVEGGSQIAWKEVTDYKGPASC